MTRTRKIFGLAAVTLVLLVVALVTVNGASAQEPTPVPVPRPRGGYGGGIMAQYSGVIDEAAAEALGLSVEEFDALRAEGLTLWQIAEQQGVDLADVQAAMAAARADILAQMVADGVITQEQADWMAGRAGGRGFGAGGFGARGARGAMAGSGLMAAYSDEMHAATAEALGLTVEEFDALLAEGLTLWEIAEQQGVDVEDVWEAREAARADVLAQMVADGVITQEQADWMLGHMAGAAGYGMGYGPGSGPCYGNDSGQTLGPRGGQFGGRMGGGMGRGWNR